MPQLAAPVLTMTAASPTTVNLSWTASPGATSYFVSYNQGATNHPVGSFTASQTMTQITGLTPGAGETFYVYAIAGSANAGTGGVGLTMPSLAAV